MFKADDFAAPLAGGRVLVVDDIPQNLKLLCRILGDAGCQAVGAGGAMAARHEIEVSLPELILLDIVMPETDGYALCREFKSSPRTKDIPIIFLSSLDEAVDKAKAFSIGGADYVTKPFNSLEVLARVAHQLKIVRMQQALQQEKQQLARIISELLKAKPQTGEVLEVLAEHLCGKVLDGRYRLDAKIGDGGFGVVYQATDLSSQRSVAVKVLRPTKSRGAEHGLSQFHQESISLCRIAHPNAVIVLDSGVTAEEIHYLVMELLSGCPLSDELESKQPVPLQRALQIIVPVCRVLIEAHAAGVLHRDIKPNNIFLHQSAGREIVKVLDFGIAKLIGDEDPLHSTVTTGQHAIGTHLYMAPERLNGEAYDGRVDVYSVGVLLYQMLYGMHAFPALNVAPTSEGTTHIQLSKSLRHLELTAPPVPSAIADVVMAALRRDPAERPTAREFLGLLLSAAQVALEGPESDKLLLSSTPQILSV